MSSGQTAGWMVGRQRDEQQVDSVSALPAALVCSQQER